MSQWVNVLKDPAKQAENFENLLKKQWPLWMERQNTSTPMFPQLSYGLVNRCMLCIEQTKGYVLDVSHIIGLRYRGGRYFANRPKFPRLPIGIDSARTFEKLSIARMEVVRFW